MAFNLKNTRKGYIKGSSMHKNNPLKQFLDPTMIPTSDAGLSSGGPGMGKIKSGVEHARSTNVGEFVSADRQAKFKEKLLKKGAQVTKNFPKVSKFLKVGSKFAPQTAALSTGTWLAEKTIGGVAEHLDEHGTPVETFKNQTSWQQLSEKAGGPVIEDRRPDSLKLKSEL